MTNTLTEQDIKLIGDMLSLAIHKFTDKGLYIPSPIQSASNHFNETYNYVMSWDSEPLE